MTERVVLKGVKTQGAPDPDESDTPMDDSTLTASADATNAVRHDRSHEAALQAFCAVSVNCLL